ncbi:hypothetical protein AMJ52_08510 [candidate division TA06 bacterium DG_78]|uniref:Gingipain propeptide domain-containing protein n=1 Tax=candidate division TA06 bacterium DG_78 TaxID=1703772 RepID=A0A0S7YA55_UNCT6|nr:MAG: hypothetical protein AMJ52_08510 [candidate division TA06 bacterium DG_78]
MREQIIVSILTTFMILNIGLAEVVQAPEITAVQDIESRLKEIESVNINGFTYSRIILPKHITFLKKGFPELLTIARSIIIPDNAMKGYRIVDTEYEIRKDVTIVPSKGNIFQNVKINTIPLISSPTLKKLLVVYSSMTHIIRSNTMAVARAYVGSALHLFQRRIRMLKEK